MGQQKTHFRYPDDSSIRTIGPGNESVRITPLYSMTNKEQNLKQIVLIYDLIIKNYIGLMIPKDED